MTSSRPYLVRAIHEWILDNELTPHLLVDIEGEGVEVPAQQQAELFEIIEGSKADIVAMP